MMTAVGIGLKMGDGLYRIDVDTMNPVLAGLILETIVKRLGLLAFRRR